METFTVQERQIRAFEFLVRADIPVFLWGEPGSGKTAFVERWAAERGYRQHTLIGSLIDPTDLSGLPMADGEMTKFLMPDWLRAIIEPGSAGDDDQTRWVVMLDELNMAPPAVTAAMLRLVHQKAIHNWHMPAGTRFVAAGNDPSQTSHAGDLPPPMASRFGHIEWQAVTGRAKLEAEASGWPVASVPEPQPGRVAAERARWSALVAEFHEARPELVQDFAGSGGDIARKGRGYPSNRTWSMAVEAAAQAQAVEAGNGLGAVRDVVGAVLSESVSTELVVYAAEMDLPDPEHWLANPELAVPQGRDDKDLAAMSAVLAAVLTDLTAARWEAALRVCAHMAGNGKPRPAVPAVHALLYADNWPPDMATLPTDLQTDLDTHFEEITARALQVKRQIKNRAAGQP